MEQCFWCEKEYSIEGQFSMPGRRLVGIKLGIEREETLALGDSESDFYMADHVGTFCLVENGLTSVGAPEFLAACENAFVTRGKIIDGWAATAELLVAARS